MSEEYFSDCGESIDPRVQIELERLNSATDTINKLEVDLDDARANFRTLLCDSASRLDALSRRLGACIEKARPYYEARMRASDASRQAQDAAVQYERANSAHSAAREMVYLAEQGLGGRCTLDPAWQEMLNHATQRVNEAEVSRATAASKHEKAGRILEETSHLAQRLQRDLRRSIAKSSLSARRSLMLINITAYQHELLMLPYFETKAQFNQQLEMQKIKVQALEKQVCNAKLTYADALRNLEQISDEIHRIRKSQQNTSKQLISQSKLNNKERMKYSDPIASFPDDAYVENIGHTSIYYNQTYIPEKNFQLGFKGTRKSCDNKKSNGIDYNDKKKSPVCNKTNITNNASYTSPKNTYSPFSGITDEYKNLPKDISPNSSPIRSKNSPEEVSGYRNLPKDHKAETNPFKQKQEKSEEMNVQNKVSHSECSIPRSQTCEWTEINLDSSSPDDVNSSDSINDKRSHSRGIPYQRLDQTSPPEISTVNMTPKKRLLNKQLTLPASPSTSVEKVAKSRIKLDTNLSSWISRSSAKNEDAATSNNSSRRQSLDNILGPTSEKMKEIFSHGMMMLNISSLTERRNSEPKVPPDVPDPKNPDNKVSTNNNTKKIPSPLEKTLTYLTSSTNEDDVGSDSDSLASCDMLTEEQIQSLMLDQDIDTVCEQLLGTPISEVCPIFASTNSTATEVNVKVADSNTVAPMSSHK